MKGQRGLYISGSRLGYIFLARLPASSSEFQEPRVTPAIVLNPFGCRICTDLHLIHTDRDYTLNLPHMKPKPTSHQLQA